MIRGIIIGAVLGFFGGTWWQAQGYRVCRADQRGFLACDLRERQPGEARVFQPVRNAPPGLYRPW